MSSSRRTWNRIRNNERGMALVYVSLGFVGFFSATVLAIDVGMFMTARSQAQNAADAGALAAGMALLYNSFDDRSSSGPAVQNAIAAATRNDVMAGTVSITPSDVTFINNSNRLRVTVHRTAERGNPLATLMGSFFGVAGADVSASATVEVASANAMTCVKPFTIPDKWIERQTPPWDPDDTFDIFDNKGNPLPDPDIYIPTSTTEVGTGFDPYRDKGLRLRLKSGNDDKLSPGIYQPIAIGGVTGGSQYRWNIGNCNTTIVTIGEMLTPEPGNMVGPTLQGVEELVLRDPSAYWDTVHNRVVSSQHPSPRVIVIPLFDPQFYVSGKKEGRNADLRVANFLGFFIEGVQGNSVQGRVTPVTGFTTSTGGPAPIGAFPKAVMLVE